MIKEIIEKMGTLIPLLTLIFGGISIRSVFMSFYTSLSYDSFDMRLLPRDKFAMIKLKKNISVFLFIIPVYCALAFLLAYEIIIFPVFLWVFSIAFLVSTVGIILRYVVSFLEFIFIKSTNTRWLHWLNRPLSKLSFIYELNVKTKIHMTLAFLLFSITMLAYGYIADVEIVLTSLTDYLITMIGISFLLIYSLKPETKSVNYIFIEENENLSNLLEKNGISEKLRLEYFLTDSITVLSTEDRVYRVIKRISESKSTYEIFIKL
ncbi:hypothetical protein QH639_14975 [Lysinibacillus sp. 1 U-2021]|uniref:hypothetical protein n=1 Tax=Lysinibacillus sp. 1 U-2021 TaxID=3039426 RepID=UPI002480C606|nr:hypothetical protein [Lysinibacillus sp. 1 U-2021]WGT37149.1 hypothetical protein QH639_14975 [Lysinibacillus sp. 1 U-2021]